MRLSFKTLFKPALKNLLSRPNKCLTLCLSPYIFYLCFLRNNKPISIFLIWLWTFVRVQKRGLACRPHGEKFCTVYNPAIRGCSGFYRFIKGQPKPVYLQTVGPIFSLFFFKFVLSVYAHSLTYCASPIWVDGNCFGLGVLDWSKKNRTVLQTAKP